MEADTIDEIIQNWKRRVYTPIVDYLAIWLAAFSTEPIYPYSFHSRLGEFWNDEDIPPLQTVYSTIKRLEKDGLIQSSQEIVDGRVQKILGATEKGFIALERMQPVFEELIGIFRQYEI